jgi:F0F1-type ATP synthase epsilon subunit
MRCQVLSPFSQALDTSVFESATIPTKGGIITVLPGHESMISALAPGVLHVKA